MLLGMVTSILIARTLGAKDYGLYSLLMMWVVLSQSLVTAGIPPGVVRFVAQARARGASEIGAAVVRYLGRVQLAKLGLALAIVAIALPLYVGLGPNSVTLVSIVLVLAAIAFRTQYRFNLAVSEGGNDFRSIAIVAWVGSASNLLLVGVASIAHLPGPGTTVFLSAYALSALVFMLVSAWASRCYRLKGAAVEIPASLSAEISRHLRIVTPSAMIGQLVGSQIEIFFLGIWAVPEDVGYFRIGLNLAVGVVALLPGTIAAVAMPYISRSVVEGKAAAAETYLKLTRYIVLLAVPVVAIATVLSQAVVITLYGPAFSGAAMALPVMTLAIALTEINTPAQCYLLSASKQHMILVFTIATLALKLTAGVLLIRHFHLAGALASILLITLIIVIGKSWLVWRDLGAGFPFGTTVRAVIFSCVAAAPAVLLIDRVAAVAVITLGGAAFAAIYGAAVLFGRCLSAADLRSARGMAENLPGIFGRSVRALLNWARTTHV